MTDAPGAVLKYCAALDRFVQIRRLGLEASAELFRGAALTDRLSYRRLVVAATVMGASTLVPGGWGNDDDPRPADDVEESLFALAVAVNPSLDLSVVAIPVEGADVGVPLLLDGLRPSPSPSPEAFLRMEEELRRRIVGQDEAITAVAAVIRKARAGLKSPRRPVGCFIFVGQTGVGKTELARAVARWLYGTEDRLVRVDCSEYASGHEYAKLIGAPPGYVGHDGGGFLTEALRRTPECVVVFDEIEKAHAKVHHLLLQIFDEGHLTDGRGNRVSFADAVVILTSNVGADEVARIERAIGFRRGAVGPDHDARIQTTRKALEKVFAPEFLNRVDEIVTFRSLTRELQLAVLDVLLAEILARVEGLGLHLTVTKAARHYLVDHGTDLKFGARPLKRAIRRWVENPLADLILSGRLRRGATIVATHRRGRESLSFDVTNATATRRRTQAGNDDPRG